MGASIGNRSPPKDANLQALRAFAALAVVVFHTRLTFAGAFGVDIFFVLSGYIMASVCERDSSFFLRRRLIRIVPPYWALNVLLFFFAQRFPTLLSSTRDDPTGLCKSLLFIPFFKAPGVIRPLLFLGWTLNYEVFFYLAIALGLGLARRRPLLWAGALMVAIMLLCRSFGRGGAVTLFYGQGIIVEFLLGVLAYGICQAIPAERARKLRSYAAAAVPVLAALLIWLQGFVLRPPGFYWKMMAPLAFLLLLATVLLTRGGWSTRWPPIALAGDSSYILYLIHPYCIFLIDRVVARPVPALRIAGLGGSALATIFALGVAIALHLGVEVPVLAFLNRRFGGRRTTLEFNGQAAI